MSIIKVFSPEKVTQKAKELFKEERSNMRLDGWFHIKEIQMDCDKKFAGLPPEIKAAKALKEVAERLPLNLSENAIFAGTQGDAFARSYALINPTFEVESFSGYCDPSSVFNDIEPNNEITEEKIDKLREYNKNSDYVRALNQTYDKVKEYTGEICFFIEQVTGHVIPDMRAVIAGGAQSVIAEIDKRLVSETDEACRINYSAMKISLEALLVLAARYATLAREQAKTGKDERKAELMLLAETLDKVPQKGATSLFEAIQSSILIWQLMCIEQSPNPFAFSVGNADRIFESYRVMDNMSRDMAAALFKHLLVFFNVGDRSWAISQNIIVGGRDGQGKDLTNECTFALFDAYYDMNLPQPILSVKFHKNTPSSVYEALGKFFFTPGCLTPSLFNDDSMFEVLTKAGIEHDDLEDYSIAGCQEPLIMGKDNGNTTNSWLNLGKILELTISNGISTITGNNIGPKNDITNPVERLKKTRELFYQNVEFYTQKMAEAANNASKVISLLPVPFLSVLMGGIESGYDMRDTLHQGTKYNGSGCLIHGLSVIADSFVAIDQLLEERPQDAGRLIEALRTNFEKDEELHQYLISCPKFGNNIQKVDEEARVIAGKVADIVAGKKNYLDNPFRPDFSTPSTHLLYGYWVGATPDGRKMRDMLNYGTDPLYGDAQSGLGFRMLSGFHLPYEKMNGGYASHFGIDPKYFKGKTYEEKGLEFRDRVITPLFFNKLNTAIAPFYLYVNVTTAETLRKVLSNPKKYAPSGVYIMRIHGTFVNFLDLSPAIQKDIITRLDPLSTAV
jgi:choline trimethylamine-lyase